MLECVCHTKSSEHFLVSKKMTSNFYIQNNLSMNVIFLDHIISPTWSVVLFQSIVCTEIVQNSLGDLPDCTELFIAYSDHLYCFLTLDSRTQYVCDTRTNAKGIYIWNKNFNNLANHLRQKESSVSYRVYMINNSIEFLYDFIWIEQVLISHY